MAKKDMDYFEGFVGGTKYALEAARRLQALLNQDKLTEDKIQEIKKIEQDADSHVHVICHHLNVAFITPIDRDDIYKIVRETDDITDSIDSVANKMWMMNVSKITQPMRMMADYVVEACEMLVKLMSEVRNHKKSKKLYEYVVEINRIEELGDKCYKDAVHELFSTEQDPIEIIRTKEIYSELEAALDNCEDVADCVEGIIITKT